MSDREALAAALAKPWPVHWEKNSIIAAATKYLAQLPEKCEHGETVAHWINDDATDGCTGGMYPVTTVETIAKAIYLHDNPESRWDRTPNPLRGEYLTYAVAVLDALNGTADG